jgi:SSS family solute:Na+ symporter
MLVIGYVCSKKNRSDEDYFMAGRNMPGIIVGISLLAAKISSIAFMAVPAFAFQYNWRYLAQYISFIIPIIIALFIMMPFFRSTHVNTAYEYLELRYSSWVRFYVAALLLTGKMFYAGTVIYVTALSMQLLLPWPVAYTIIIFGSIVAIYTIMGGLEAVIWTDFFQGIILLIGAIIIIPVVCSLLPGGFGQILSQGWKEGKMSMGDMSLSLQGKGFWVTYINGGLAFLMAYTTDQTFIQRYCAPKNLREARKSFMVGAFSYLPVMFYFLFVGTALYVLYSNIHDDGVSKIKPEQIVPYFILTRMPSGLKGLVIIGIVSAALGTLSAVTNSNASILSYDFYKRLIGKNKSDKHYVFMGKIMTIVVSIFMILAGIYLLFNQSAPILDILLVVSIISMAGLFSVFLLGFVTTRVSSKSLLLGLSICVPLVVTWLFLKSSRGAAMYPEISAKIPDNFWVGVAAEMIMMPVLYFSSFIPGWKNTKELTGLTIWTKSENKGNC